jgi:hypothetical protein
MVVDKMARLVIDRALRGAASQPWPRWEELLGVGASGGFVGSPKSAVHAATAGARALAPAAGLPESGAPAK